MEDFNQSEQAPRSWLLLRPVQTIMPFPLAYRWEFTRRHPYYLLYWQSAVKHHQAPSADARERRAEEAAVLILAGIGISQVTEPIDPRLGAEAFDSTALGAAWASGSVAPATLRTLAMMLMLALPPAQRAELGRLLTESAEFDSRDSVQMQSICLRLGQLQNAVWNSFPDAPVLSINLQMPQRAINEAVEQLVRQWKQDRGISERRRRDDSLDDYLAVWDLREGWLDGEYIGAREMTFQTISQEIGIPIATATTRYRSAFRNISGHDYTPELWIRLMGPLKISQTVDRASAGLLFRRPWRSPHPRPVTEAVLLPGRNECERPQFLEAAAVTESEIGMVDLSLDIQTLLGRGLSDEQIIRDLELESELAAELVAELRRRFENR